MNTMSRKQNGETVNAESRIDAMIQRLVSAWLNENADAPSLSAKQKAQFVAWVGADAERWLHNNWHLWPGRPRNASHLKERQR